MPPHDSQHPPPAPPTRTQDPNALANELCKKHAEAIQKLLDQRKDVLEESKKDIAQRVRMVLSKHVHETGKAPPNVVGFLTETVRKVVADHKKKKRLDVEDGASASQRPSTEADPEGTAELRELQQKMASYTAELPAHLKEVLWCVHGLEMSLDDTATALSVSRTTVKERLAAAKEMLDKRARASERRADERVRRHRK